jgi:hypothetical protein
MTTKWEIARRDLLKSLGIGAACLPILTASKKSWAQGADKKFFIIHATAGFWMANWRPNAGSLLTQTLPSSSAPLEPHKADLVYLINMANPKYTVGANWGHECYGTIYWGGEQKAPGGSKYQEPSGTNAKSVDQWVAEGLPKAPGGKLSLNFQVQVDRKPSSGTTGSSRCFWRGAGQPINPELNPAKTYAAIFAGMPAGPMTTGPDPAVVKLLAQKRSILDYVGTSLTKFGTRVGREDKQFIEGHLKSIRELEAELSGMGGGGTSVGRGTAMDPGAFTDEAILADAALFPKIMDAYIDMGIAGLKSGVTRVVTLQLSNSSGNQLNFGAFVKDIPARGTGYKSAFRNWHDLGHNPVMDGTNHKIIVDKWCMDKFASMLTRMKGIQEPGGNMLGNSLVLWGNHMESGDNHHSQRIPWILAGKAGGNIIKSGTVASGQTISAAMGDICKIMGVQGAPHMTGSAGAT